MKPWWDANMPFETLIDQVETASEIAEAGGAPFMMPQIKRWDQFPAE